MKKTKRLISVAALLLAAVMLFSSCALSYRDANTGEYVQLTEGFDINTVTLADVVLNKMIVKDADVTSHINHLLYDMREINKDLELNHGGAFNKYDVLTLRTFIYDLDGNLIAHDFDLASKADPDEDGTVNLEPENSLPLGYGDGINADLLLALEKALFLSPESTFTFDSFYVVERGINAAKVGVFGAIPSVAFISYSSEYIGKTGSPQVGGTGDAKDVVHFEKIAERFADPEYEGASEYTEAIYLGLKELIERRAETDPNNLFNPSTTKSVKINVYPTESGVDLSSKTFSADETHILYDLVFDGGGTEYAQGAIEVSLVGALADTEGNTDGGAFITRYTYPSDEEGKYKAADGEERELKDRECVVYTYILGRTPCTRPEYNAETVKTELDFETDKTDDAEVIAAYEAHVKTELQEACDAEAKAAAKEALWNAVMAKTSLIKEPKRNIKNYVNEYYDNATLYWTQGGYSTKKDANDNFLYDNKDEFILKLYSVSIDPRKDANGKAYTTIEALDAALYEEARALVKGNLLTYYLADTLGCRYTEAELLAMAETRGTAWAKEQLETSRASLIEQYTVAGLQKIYTTEDSKKSLFDTYGATSFEDCLNKMLAMTGCATWDEYAEKYYPDDAYTWETYVEYMQGEENLFGTYHYERVLEKLYEVNVDNIDYTEIDYKAS